MIRSATIRGRHVADRRPRACIASPVAALPVPDAPAIAVRHGWDARDDVVNGGRP